MHIFRLNAYLMELYRKSDLYYVYEHDRMTIKALKRLEQELQLSEKDKDDPFAKNSGYFRERAVRYAQSKEDWIRAQITIDERKDRLLAQHPIPGNVRCDTCGAFMLYMNHLFRKEDTEVIFVFSCSQKHLPNKAVYPSGKEYSFPKRKCDNCGHQIHSAEEKKGNILYFIDTCSGCGKVTSWDLDMGFEPEPDMPVTDEDRQKYCTKYIGQKTFEQDLQAIADFCESNKIQLDGTDKEKEEFSIDKIEHLTVPQLEEKLIKKVEKSGFVKFQFDKPQIDKYVIVGFSAQDLTSRKGSVSEKVLSKLLKKELLTTNWRLMVTGINYRLGFLTGQLKGYERDSDLEKIAKEISTQRNRRNKNS